METEVEAIRKGLRASLEEMSRQVATVTIQRLQTYEAEHGEVTPAPRKARMTKRSSIAQIMAIIKRTLIDSGWLETDKTPS